MLDCAAGPIMLKIEARPEWFVFSIQPDQSDVLELGSGESHLLSTEVAGGFTGVIIAMYAVCETGQGRRHALIGSIIIRRFSIYIYGASHQVGCLVEI